MKKDALHFKVAAWSIKHPGQSYAAMALVVAALLVLCVVATRLFALPSNPARLAVPTAAALQAPASFQKAGWVITSRQMIGDRQCLMYQKISNATRLTSCYVRQGDGWVFQQSF